ncbi:hypothetical protein EOPP23_03240 [Endozoicomonas sp. OPT23]|uniref:DUF6279 family lipoprotein n=1 Tax=Endozoicomonas sp. OPT23 TaxID=2072845 RepID=UPI00129A2BE6|nr:DUF6279 family lipoprotein [Endozoicomonas sp. OPT23]MRI32013.1 hypothetical protein [Endozoicomonas sp. OPT23]
MAQLLPSLRFRFSFLSAGKAFLVLSFFLLLSGCTTKFAYNNADWLIHWYLDDYIDLNKNQRNQFDESFSAFISWHRKEELPRYLDWLKSIKAQLEDQTLSEQELFLGIQQANEQLFTFTRRLIDKAKPELQSLAATFTEKQKKRLVSALEKKTDETAKRFAKLKTIESQRKEYRQNFQEQIRERFGKLTREQLRQLDQWQQQIIPAFSQQLEARREWSRRLSVAFSHPAVSLMPLLSSERPWQSGEFKELIIHNRTLSEEFVAYMLATRTPKQHKKLMKELNKLIRTIESLQGK